MSVSFNPMTDPFNTEHCVRFIATAALLGFGGDSIEDAQGRENINNAAQRVLDTLEQLQRERDEPWFIVATTDEPYGFDITPTYDRDLVNACARALYSNPSAMTEEQCDHMFHYADALREDGHCDEEDGCVRLLKSSGELNRWITRHIAIVNNDMEISREDVREAQAERDTWKTGHDLYVREMDKWKATAQEKDAQLVEARRERDEARAAIVVLVEAMETAIRGERMPANEALDLAIRVGKAAGE